MQENKSLNRLRLVGLALAAAATLSLYLPAASAHHSFGKFEMMKLTTLRGTVRDWKWANPHTWLTLAVEKADGSTEEWALVGSSPNMMARWGWNATDIHVGDKVTVDVHAGRDGEHIGAIKNVFLPGGKSLTDPAGSNGQELAGAGPAVPPSKPEGELYK
jgi:hypothetical protein